MAVVIHPQQAFVVGDVWTIQGQLQDALGNKYDPTPASNIIWKLSNATATLTYITLTLNNGIVVGPVSNWFDALGNPFPGVIITVPQALTGTLTASPPLYMDQLRLIVSGVPSTFWEGPINVLPQMP